MINVDEVSFKLDIEAIIVKHGIDNEYAINADSLASYILDSLEAVISLKLDNQRF